MPNSETSLYERMAALEASHEHLIREVTRLTEVLRETNRTPWGSILAGLAIVVTVCGGALAYVNKVEAQLRFSISRLYDYHHSQASQISSILDRVRDITPVDRPGPGKRKNH